MPTDARLQSLAFRNFGWSEPGKTIGLAIVPGVPDAQSNTPRWLLVVPFVAIFGGVLVGGHLYIAQRLIYDPELPGAWETALFWLLALLWASLILQPIAERRFPVSWSRRVAWPASLWMGFAFLLLMALMASDLLLFLVGLLSSADWGVKAARTQAAFVFLLVLGASAVALRSGLSFPGVRRVEIPLANWPRGLDGFKVVQISDIHIGPILDRQFSEELVQRVNSLGPDLVAVTGDLVDGPVEKIGPEVAPFAGLKARQGVFFVTGNHDFYSGADPWVSEVEKLGMRALRNTHVVIGNDAGAFALVGVDDHRADMMSGAGGEDLDAALEGVPEELPRLLMAHDPSTFKRASRRQIDLQISGHTHGGQIWPFRWFVRAAIPFVAGVYQRGHAKLYVSRGTGFWGPPMRLGAPSEITEITIRSSQDSA